MISNGSENNMVMPVAPMYGGNGGCGFGSGWGDGWWILLLLLFAGGWNNGFGGGFGGEGGVLPYMWNTQTQNDVNRGFDNAGIAGQLNGIQSSITNGFASAEISGCNRAMDAMQTSYNNQIASMNQRFADTTAITNSLTNLSAQLAQCCCDNRLATANLTGDIAREACATRTADAQNTQAILGAINGGVQSIKDQLCQDKIDAKNEKIADLERQLISAQNNALLQKGFSDEVDALYNRLSNCPVPSMPVYGRTPIFTCNSQNGCGCGM